jgi:RpiR family carbohydrate utilization transcriptional regulator
MVLIAKVKAQLQDLRPSERRVAELLLAQPVLTAGSSIRLIAAQAGVSEPTVVRFCRAVGCRGVQDLKRQLGRELARRAPAARPASAARSEDVVMLADRLLDRGAHVLQEARAALAGPGLNAAGAILRHADRVFFWGAGEAGEVAGEAARAFVTEGLPALSAGDLVAMSAQARQCGPQGAVVLISFWESDHPGARALEAAARFARGRGARLIGVAPSNGPLLALCEVQLPVGVMLDPTLDAVTATLGARCLLAALRAGWAAGRDAWAAPQ